MTKVFASKLPQKRGKHLNLKKRTLMFIFSIIRQVLVVFVAFNSRRESIFC